MCETTSDTIHIERHGDEWCEIKLALRAAIINDAIEEGVANAALSDPWTAGGSSPGFRSYRRIYSRIGMLARAGARKKIDVARALRMNEQSLLAEFRERASRGAGKSLPVADVQELGGSD